MGNNKCQPSDEADLLGIWIADWRGANQRPISCQFAANGGLAAVNEHFRLFEDLRDRRPPCCGRTPCERLQGEPFSSGESTRPVTTAVPVEEEK